MIRDARRIPNDIAGYDPTRGGDEYSFDHEDAEKPVRFFAQCLAYIKGLKANQPFILEDWQADVVRTIFGWKNEDGTRRYRKVFITVPRKNGKSTWIAGLADYILFCDGEAGAECYCAASDREQASLVFNTAARMVEKAPSLNKRCKVRHSQKRIIYDGSFLRAIPANEGGSHGFDSHLIVGDEIHAWPGREFYDVLQTSTGARAQPLELYITTAGYDRLSVCYEIYQYAKSVRDGKIDDAAFLPVIYESEETDDWDDREVWQKANPNLGVSVHLDYLEGQYKRAVAEPRFENTFRRLHLNQWTSQETRWLPMHTWRACRSTPGFDVGTEAVYGGLDLSQKNDLTAYVKLIRTEGGYKLIGHYYLPEALIPELEKQHHAPYSQWIRDGWITATPGTKIDKDFIHRHVLEDSEKYQMRYVGYDPWNALDTETYLAGEGLEMISVRQGYASLSEPSKELESCVKAGTWDTSGDPVMEWCAENVMVKTDENGNIRPVKPQHGDAKKIDGIVASLIALVPCFANRPPGPSVYERGGQLAL